MKGYENRKTLAVMAVVLALLAAACGAAATPPPTPAPTQPPPTPTQPAASEVLVSAEEDVLGIWQVEGATGGPLLVTFARFAQASRDFSIFAGSGELDRGLFTVKENQLTFVSELKTCRLCKGSYQVYVTRQDGRPARLRFVLSGQDPNAQRAEALNGKTATPLSGALPGEALVSRVEDVNGIWQENEAVTRSGGPVRFTFQNGQFTGRLLDEIGYAGSIVAKDGKLEFHDVQFGDGSYIVYVKRQAGQPVWLRFISTGDEDVGRERLLHGRIFLLQSAP